MRLCERVRGHTQKKWNRKNHTLNSNGGELDGSGSEKGEIEWERERKREKRGERKRDKTWFWRVISKKFHHGFKQPQNLHA